MIENTLDHPDSLKDVYSDLKWSKNHFILPIIKRIVEDLSSEEGHDPAEISEKIYSKMATE